MWSGLESWPLCARMTQLIRYLKHWQWLQKNWLSCFFGGLRDGLSTRLSFRHVTFSLVLMFGMTLDESIVLQRRCTLSGAHILSFSFLSTLQPLQLAELQLCTSQDQRTPSISQIHLCSDWITPQSSAPPTPTALPPTLPPAAPTVASTQRPWTHSYTSTHTHKIEILTAPQTPTNIFVQVSSENQGIWLNSGDLKWIISNSASQKYPNDLIIYFHINVT